MGLFYSGAKDFVLAELAARKGKGYAESRRALGVYVTINTSQSETTTAADGTETKTMTPGGTLSSLKDKSLGGRYSTDTGKPTPALTSLKIEMSGEYGSLKQAELSVNCFDKPSFEKFERQFLIPGTDIVIDYGRVGASGEANNGKFEGVVYDYSFKLNQQLGYDCELKAVAKGSMVTEMNVNSKLGGDREFTSDYDGFNDITPVTNICDVFDYDVQTDMEAQENLTADDGVSFVYAGYENAIVGGTDCPDAGPEPTQDGMVGGNIIFCSLGYIVNKLINFDLLQGNIEAATTTGKNKLKYVCNDQVTIGMGGAKFAKIFSANPMKVVFTGGPDQYAYGGMGAKFAGQRKDWCSGFDGGKVINGTDTAKLANILISRDTLRECAGVGSTVGEEGSKVSLGSFLAAIFQVIYSHSGGAWDLTCSEFTKTQAADYGVAFDPNAMYIIDRNWAPGANAEKIHLNALNAGVLDNSTRNVQIVGKVPKDMAAAAMVGGTGVASGKKGATVAEKLSGKPASADDLKAELMKNLKVNRENIHDNGYSDEEIDQAKTNLKAYVEGGQSAGAKATFRKDMYPLELSATIDGINGIEFGNAVDSDLVPSRYLTGTPRIVFTVTKTSHSIQGNDWTTDVETICRVEP